VAKQAAGARTIAIKRIANDMSFAVVQFPFIPILTPAEIRIWSFIVVAPAYKRESSFGRVGAAMKGAAHGRKTGLRGIFSRFLFRLSEANTFVNTCRHFITYRGQTGPREVVISEGIDLASLKKKESIGKRPTVRMRPKPRISSSRDSKNKHLAIDRNRLHNSCTVDPGP
jgi:hypothetical protein